MAAMLCSVAANAQSASTDPKAGAGTSQTDTATGENSQDPLKRELTDAQKKRNAKEFKKEVSKEYRDWLEKDVAYIITPEEEAAFKSLSNNEERDQFIEQFWLRRDPTPDTPENEYKEEHYRRIAYANEHFAAGKPGWMTDRGKIYIRFGPPDEIDAHPSGGYYLRPTEEGGGSTSTYPFETWRYRYIEGIGSQVEIEFVDTCQCGDYHISLDPSEKDALLYVPGAGLTQSEEMGLTSKADRLTGAGNGLESGIHNGNGQNKEFDRLEQWAKLQRAPEVKFKDLEEVVTHKIRVNVMPFEVRTDFVKVTDDTVLVPITIQVKNRDMTFVNKDGVQRGVVNIFGRVSTLTGRVAQTFEDTVNVDVPAELLPQSIDHSSIYWKALPLRVGRYRLDVVVKDVNGDRVGSWTRGIMVPDMSEDRGLAASSLIVADEMEKVPTREVGAGNFVLGDTRVRPRLDSADGKPATFKNDQRLNFWMQVYNLGIDDKTKKSNATVEYQIVDTATKQSIVNRTEDTAQLGNNGDQVTLEKSMPLQGLKPGTYQITIKVNDLVANRSISPTARFTVE